MFTNFAIIRDPLPFWPCYKSTLSFEYQISLRVSFFIWWLATSNIKLIGLYQRNIRDLRFMPVSIFFTYFHSCIKIDALSALSEVRSYDISYQLACLESNLDYRQAEVVDRIYQYSGFNRGGEKNQKIWGVMTFNKGTENFVNIGRPLHVRWPWLSRTLKLPAHGRRGWKGIEQETGHTTIKAPAIPPLA
jgi:hypothetical protein